MAVRTAAAAAAARPAKATAAAAAMAAAVTALVGRSSRGLRVSAAVHREKSVDSVRVDEDGTAGYIDELLVPQSAREPSDENDAERLRRAKLTSTRREALALYRNCLRATRLFEWEDELGRPWRSVLHESTRQEFEAARFERDPEIVTRLLVGGRDCLTKTLEKFAAKQDKLLRGGGGGLDGTGSAADGAAAGGGGAGGGVGRNGWPPR